VVAAGGAFWLAKNQAEGPDEAVEPPAAGLPNTPDYHSLLVDPTDPRRIFLGTHVGLYASIDGGRSWEFARLEGQDAMNLARASGETVWTAGHNVLARSADGGTTWEDVRPDGLPSLDVHGFAVDPRDPDTLWAAIAGKGLYRSTDGGVTFDLVSQEVGGAVMALGVLPDGRIFAGDMEQGLLVSEDDGKSWRQNLAAGLMGLAVNPEDPKRILAAGPGILLSTDGGKTWDQVQSIEPGAGPVAWAPSDPQLAYAVGFDRTLYRTTDGGASWQAVG
jgi:photosystem II stability/assembly factor-like uncharacterized protein